MAYSPATSPLAARHAAGKQYRARNKDDARGDRCDTFENAPSRYGSFFVNRSRLPRVVFRRNLIG
jgi:hypothetical protein